ncbi:glycosyl hydrolase [Paenibacillus sp. 598K]|uniref:glycosyl hydrolase n=1 Tax=Paenibacillus sp. 598K TaxID=1117987 RepID=UPI001628CBEE|nr:glycosyl hydrolase [Paenibacillus sp. 598K]
MNDTISTNARIERIAEALREPEAKWRIQPFWFWNGELADEEIVRQIGEMAAQGVGGFFICARQGMQVAYLSDAWFAKVRVALDAVLTHGLEAWLYDEYPYPSGIAGGEVTLAHPDAKQRLLTHRNFTARGEERCDQELPWGKVLSARAVPRIEGRLQWSAALDVRRYIGSDQVQPVFQKTGLTSYNQKRFFTYQTAMRLQWTPPAGEWEVHVFLEEELEDFKYYGTFVDPCHEEAMATFIRLTHQRYADELGEYFGRPIRGIFTDEIAPLGKMPWSPRLPEAFYRRNGYLIEDHLEALIGGEDERARDAGDGAAPARLPATRVRYDFFQTMHELLQEAYHRPVSDWCESHGLAYVTEVPSMRMATQAHSHVPGGDSAHEKLGRSLDWILDRYTADLRANPKMVSSVAAQYGRERALIECFHSVGWSMTLQDAKWMIDRMAAMGINFYNFHAFFYTLDGMTQHDAPPSQFDQNPYWRHFRALADYTGRISKLMGSGRAVRRIAMLDPATTLWTMLANPLHKYDYAGEDLAERERLTVYKRYWIDLCKTLLAAQRDYDHLDPETLAERGQVESGVLRVGDAAYELIVLPPLANLEARAWERLRQFIDAGGHVIALGMLPYESIEDDDKVARELRERCGLAMDAGGAADFWHSSEGSERAKSAATERISSLGTAPGMVRFIASGPTFDPAVREQLLRELEMRLLEPVRLVSTAQSLLVQQRELEGGVRAVFVSHQESGEASVELIVGAGAPVVCELDLETGAVAQLRLELLQGNEEQYVARLRFAPYQSRLILIDESGQEETGGPLSEAGGEYGAAASADEREGTKALTLEASTPEVAASEVLTRETRASEALTREAPARDASVRASASRDTALPGEPEQLVLSAAGMWEVRPLGDHAIRFDDFEVALHSADGRSALGVFRAEAKTFIAQVADAAAAGVALPLAFDQPFGTPMRTALAYPLRASYTAIFDIERMPERCLLLMDRSAIGGDWRILLNGHPVTADELTATRYYDNSNLSCAVDTLLQPGKNQLTVEVEIHHDWQGVTDALYLVGPFGVSFAAPHRPVMTALPEVAELQAGPYPGLPYYAGDLVFRRSIELSEQQLPRGDRFQLSWSDLDAAFHDCAQVMVNGHPLGLRAWSPYVWDGDSAILQPGANTVEVTVTTTLIGLLEGRYFDEASHALYPVQSHPLFAVARDRDGSLAREEASASAEEQ